jgi:serine/threonine protein phosphatase PrpC
MINLTAASLTDTGMIREMNEDSVWTQVYHTSKKEPVGLFIVCDGMGGHLGGEIASYWAVEAIKRELADLFVPKDPRATVILTEEEIQAARAGKLITPKVVGVDIEDRMRTAIQKANNVVYNYAMHKPDQAGNAGTTLTMGVVHGDKLVVANAGDSRTYLLRNHELRQITVDHSLVANMVENGQILPDEVYSHPQRNVIYRFLGQKGLVKPDIYHETLLPGDHLLLCSDGLWEMVHSDPFIVQIIEVMNSPMHACRALVEAANEAGGEDNIAVIVVQVT